MAGGAQGGNGGHVEISAPSITAVHTRIDGQAQPGWVGGTFLLDPDYIVLDQSGGDTLNVSGSDGSLLVGDSPGDTLYLNVGNSANNFLDSAFLGLSQITLQAKYNITLASGTAWSLSDSTGQTAGQLLLEAGGDIVFQDGSSIFDANNWSVTLKAGVNDFIAGAIQPGAGNIFLNGGEGLSGGGSILTTSGSIALTAGRNIETGSGSLQDANFNSLAVGSASGPVSLSAGNDIQIASGFVETVAGGNLELTSGQDVQIGMNSGVTATGGGGVNITASAGSLTDSGSIQTDTGDINVTAKQDVTLAGISSSIVTTGGGNIDVTAVAGSVNTGVNPNGFTFYPSFYTVNTPSLGGISTGDGGNVDITAGLDIISYLPAGNKPAGDAGSGAFITPDASGHFANSQKGNVTLTAGRNVVGHYVVSDGTGTINAGVNIPLFLATGQVELSNPNGNAGTPSANLALSLIDGGWTVNAANDINLQEVRNPNGIFNKLGNASSPTYHRFDYALDDYVDLNAGNAIQLGGNLPRNPGEGSIPSIYPSILNITAGAGGVIIGNEIVLFPSPQGSLNISTTGGGPFETSAYAAYLLALAAYDPASGNPTPPKPAGQVEFIMSDSGASRWTSTASFSDADHAATPVHLDHPTVVNLNISGSMDNINLVVPEAAQINVAGDMNNCAFAGQNLSSDPGQTVQIQVRESDGSLGMATVYPGLTSITVTGDILNQNIYNSVTLAKAPDLFLLNEAFGASYSDLFNRLFYDPKSGQLTLQGALSDNEYTALTRLMIQAFYPDGQPILDLQGNPTEDQNPVSILDTTAAQKLKDESQGAPSTPNPGFVLGGGGVFNVTAHTLDLGATLGLMSVGVANNAALAYNPKTGLGFLHGANINVNLSGDLDMFSTAISTLNGGDISVNAAGTVNVGSTYISGNDQYARGIFTVQKSDVTVTAGGNIEVAGSRIAAYDGGNVTVESLNGNVDAGTGGSGSVAVQEFYVDPLTGQIFSFEPVIPGSGILATTFPPRGSYYPAPVYSVGNILVETPQGDINASAGGIVQLPLNGADSSGATVTLLAGEDAGGNVLSADRNIDVGGSGVIGSIVTLKASGSIIGLVFARNDANVNAQQNADVTVLAQGVATVNAGGNLSGSVIGIGGLSASGASVSASLLSQNISPGVETSGAKGFAQGTTANNASTGLANDQTTKAVATTDTADEDPDKKRKGPELVKKVSRVTVILPPKNLSENQSSNNHL